MDTSAPQTPAFRRQQRFPLTNALIPSAATQTAVLTRIASDTSGSRDFH